MSEKICKLFIPDVRDVEGRKVVVLVRAVQVAVLTKQLAGVPAHFRYEIVLVDCMVYMLRRKCSFLSYSLRANPLQRQLKRVGGGLKIKTILGPEMAMSDFGPKKVEILRAHPFQ